MKKTVLVSSERVPAPFRLIAPRKLSVSFKLQCQEIKYSNEENSHPYHPPSTPPSSPGLTIQELDLRVGSKVGD